MFWCAVPANQMELAFWLCHGRSNSEPCWCKWGRATPQLSTDIVPGVDSACAMQVASKLERQIRSGSGAGRAAWIQSIQSAHPHKLAQEQPHAALQDCTHRHLPMRIDARGTGQTYAVKGAMQAHTPLDLNSQLASAARPQLPECRSRAPVPGGRKLGGIAGPKGKALPFLVVEKNFPSVMAGRLPVVRQRSSRLTDHLRRNARHTAALSNLMVDSDPDQRITGRKTSCRCRSRHCAAILRSAKLRSCP